MFNRPRCRDWTALATQQLRLRNLIQISGHNIVCEPKSSIYFTLHLTSMSAPFFTSDKLESRKNTIWPEINCQSILKSTAHSVCIRVWQRTSSLSVSKDEEKVIGGEKPAADTNIDSVLFLWSVYFSGLVAITRRSDVKLRENSLVFHIHGGFFTSAACLLPESVPRQLEFIGSLRTQKRSTLPVATENCDQIVLSRNSIMNMEFGAKAGAVDLVNSTLPGERKINGGSVKLPNAFEPIKISSSPSASSHLRVTTEVDPELMKVRFIEMNFFKSEIRSSYTVEKLLLLQDKQRRIRYKTESAKQLMDKICMKSAFCLDLELIANKAMLYRPRGNPSMGRTLNRLLFQQTEQPKPEVLLKAHEIRCKIETAKFRCRMLVQERNQAHVHIRQLERKLGDINDATVEQESWLMANYRGLSKEKEAAAETAASMVRQQRVLGKINESLHQRRQQLLRELKEIYCIQRGYKNIFTINGAALPSAESFTELTSPSATSVALGYAAHLTVMCSSILNCSLRNPIIYKGSASKIRDDIKDMHDHDREFPLYCRTCPPPDAVRYAIFLLSQNIAQIKMLFGLCKEDLRETLCNLLQLLNGPLLPPPPLLYHIETGVQPHHLHSNDVHDSSSTSMHITTASMSALSMDVIVPVNSLKNPIHIDHNTTEKRISRSVGSYPEEFESNNRSGHFGSEPILSTGRVQVLSNFADNGNI